MTKYFMTTPDGVDWFEEGDMYKRMKDEYTIETIGFVYHSNTLEKEVLKICYQQLAFHPNKPSIYILGEECSFNILPQ